MKGLIGTILGIAGRESIRSGGASGRAGGRQRVYRGKGSMTWMLSSTLKGVKGSSESLASLTSSRDEGV